jgi:DNA-binding CsgD family transcriptional regulator/PAS domain-containing protein
MPVKRPLAETDDIISRIYQGPLEAKPWQSFLRALRLRMDCEVAAISLRPGRTDAAPLVIWDRRESIKEEQLRRLAADHARLAHLDHLSNALKKPGDIFTLDEVMPRAKLLKSEFYKKIIKPHDIERQLGMYFAEPSGWECNIGLMNGAKRPNFGEAEKDFFMGFRPHLEKALEIYARLKRNQLEKEILEDSLDRLAIGTFILDGRGRVIDTNRVARETVKSTRSLSLVDDRLTLKKPDDNARLARAIKQAIAAHKTPNTFVEALRITSQNDPDVGLLVKSMPLKDRYQTDVSPSVIIYVGDSAQRNLAQEGFIAQLFGLTPTEAFLATLLADGLTLAEAAVKLGVTGNTVRSYAKKIFAKTGVGRQADLVRLILKSVALLA